MDLIDWTEVTAHDQRAAYYHEVEQYLGFTQHKEELQQVLEHIKRLELSHASDSQNTI